jgi:SAM-dependent methyltransferase
VISAKAISAFRRLARLLLPRSVRDRIRPLVLKESPTPKEVAPELAVAEEIRRRREHAGTLRSLVESEPWCVDTVRLDGTMLEFSGWAIAPDGDPSSVTFVVCDREPDRVEYPQPSEDVGEIFWYLPQASRARFSCRVELTPEEAARPVVFKFIRRGTLEPINRDHSYYYLRPTDDPFPMPDPVLRRRVVASESESGFRVEGFTAYVKLGQALERTFERGYPAFRRILDWGCGCGRVTRYLNRTGSTVTGADIDGQSVEWCRLHLSFASFARIPLHPPTSFPDASFDLLFGISVFTHLSERDQGEWLAELKRIAAPGAVLLMSVHGSATMARVGLPMDMIGRWNEEGFLDVGANLGLDDVLAKTDKGFYRDTFHSGAYVRANWGKDFEIVDIIPAYVGNLQDLVVMRRA